VRVEDRLEAAAVLTSGDTVQPLVKPTCSPGERHDGDDQDEDDRAQADDDLAEVPLDERVEVDRWSSGGVSRV